MRRPGLGLIVASLLAGQAVAEAGFEVRPPPPPPSKMYDALPTNWVRMEKETPLFEKCSD